MATILVVDDRAINRQYALADFSDPHELIARAAALSTEFATPITPGFEALVFKASRGIADLIAAGCEICIIKPIDTRELPKQLEKAAGMKSQ